MSVEVEYSHIEWFPFEVFVSFDPQGCSDGEVASEVFSNLQVSL